MRKIEEAGLSRFYEHMISHDTGTISAFRKRFTHAENQVRNRILQAKLMRLGYKLIVAKGIYIEDFNTPEATEVRETAFFVIDARDGGNLLTDLKKLGEEFDQDSIMYIPKGVQEGAYLWGTNHTAEFPGYGKMNHFPTLTLGREKEFMTKKGKRPFAFESIEREVAPPESPGYRQAVAYTARLNWQEEIKKIQ